jgi:SAM-dependent methyltransferase
MKEYLKRTIFYRLYRQYRSNQLNKLAKNYKSESASDFFCIGCNKNWKSFKALPQIWFTDLKKAGWQYELDDSETLNHKSYSCYGCGITDRDRLYLMYLQKVIDQNREYNIVEFAPSPSLTAFLKKYQNVKVRTSDLFMEGVDDVLDLQNLYLYQGEQFDCFICSHILEHVDNDILAMQELYRITKLGGFGIAMVPILEKVIITKEDIINKDKSYRKQHFGQGDHVRLYAKHDFISRLESVGFKVKLLDANYFGKDNFEKNGISAKSVLYIVEKN